MKKLYFNAKNTISASLIAGALCLLAASPLNAVDASIGTVKSMNIGVINFKQCVEKSKMGKQEQASFETLKKQAEQVLQDKEKELTDLARKLEDTDFMDSLSKEAEAELKHRFRSLNQELTQQQQQLYQTLSQANYKILQKLNDEVNKAAKKVAEERKLDLVLNEDAVFYYQPNIDVTDDVVKALDANQESSK